MLKAVEETFLGQILFGNSYIFGTLKIRFSFLMASEKKSEFLKSQIYYIFFQGGGCLCFLCCIGGGNQYLPRLS